MLTTDDRLSLEEYSFKGSPESCSTAYSTDYTDFASDEDFLHQLSSDLDIPLLLNQGEDDLSLLNSFLDKSPAEIMSEILPFDDHDDDPYGSLDLLRLQPDAFPVKSEPESLSGSDSHKSDSPRLSPVDDIKQEPVYFMTQVGEPKAGRKRVATIQPKVAPYAAKNSARKVVVVKNGSILGANRQQAPKVVVLENLQAMPVKNIAQMGTNFINGSRQRTISPVLLNSTNNLSINVGNFDPKMLKRQQRKIKNRESACLSRKRKKDYLTSLEMQVKDLANENQRLKLENGVLKEKLSKYEGGPKKQTNVKNSIVLCVFLLSLGFHLDYLKNPFVGGKLETQKTESKVLTRQLLWTDENSSIENSSTFLPFSMCPASINQSESARLVLELERWIGKPRLADDPKLPVATNSTKLTKLRTKTKLKKRKLMRSRDNSLISSLYLKNIAPMGVNNEIQVFQPSAEQLYSEFFEAINRQEDTFYVVSFSDHHMLLPALHHNKTRRPKMSLIMPSMLPTGNSSLVPLMQIDCEVLDTRLIQIRSGTIPQHLRTNETNYQTGDGPVSKSNEGNTNYTNKKAYKPYFIKQNSVKATQSDLSL